MLFTSAEVSSIIGSFLWPLFRIGAMVMALPVFSSGFIPTRVRLAIAIGITIIVAPVIPPVPEIDAISVQAIFLIMQQLLIGIVMGFIFHMVFAVFIIGGQIIAMQMGLGFSMMVDPMNGSQSPVLSMFYLLLVTLFFLLLDGHLALIGVLADSFRSMPISDHGITTDGYWRIVVWGAEMFKGAVMVSLPAVTALLLVNMSLGVMGRAAPQLNIFAVGFVVTIIAGFFILMMTMPVVLTQFEETSVSAMTLIKSLVNQE